MYRSEELREPGPAAPADEVLAPARRPVAPGVTIVVVAHEPGLWFEESLAAVGAQDYPELEVVVVDVASAIPIESRVRDVLPDAHIVRLDENRGFGRAVNAVLPTLADSPFIVLAHDDAAPEPNAVRVMVEEAFRSNAAVIGPKVLRWDDAGRMLSAGEGTDKFGYPVALVERHELDQEQHDSVRDVFNVPDAFTMVRTDLIRVLGGFDPEGSFFGDDLDLCWRAHVVGARVLVAPSARVRHMEALGERRVKDDRRRLQFRHRMRVMLTSYRLPRLLVILPQLFVVHLVEILFALVTGRPAQARDVVSAWTWNARRFGALRARRKALRKIRQVPDSEIRALQVRGSARVLAFLRGELATGEDTFGSAASFGKRVTARVAGPGNRAALLTWLVVAAVLIIGSRHLITRPIPAVGEFVPFPEQLGPLVSEWMSSWRRSGLGSEGFAAPANLLVAVGGTVFLGATGLLRTVLILGMVPLGLLGVWRLVAPVHSSRASAVALVAYAAIPLGYDSLATGSWRGLIAYGIAPWVLARMLRGAGTAPFGAADPPAGPRGDVPPLWRQAMALGILVAIAAVLDPLFILLPLVIWVGLVPGSLVAAGIKGLGQMLVVAVGAGSIAAAMHAPWLFELVGTDPSWSTFVASRSSGSEGLELTSLLRFDTGPIGSSILNAAVVLAAAFVLLVGRQWRLLWAARAWSVALCSWALVWVAGMGWLPFALPPEEMLLAPAAAGMALAVGLGAAAFELDVRRSNFGWRQFASLAAVAALVVAFLPIASASVGGRWLVPRGSHDQLLGFLAEEADDDVFRVVWFGDPEVLPLGSWPLGELTSYGTTMEGTPVLADLWPGPAESESAPLRGSLELALDQSTNRLGRVLAPMGVRYLVVVDQAAPRPFGGLRRPSPPALRDALAEQLDLVQIDVNPAVTVYRNDAWIPLVSAFPGGTVPTTDGPAIPDGARVVAGSDLSGAVLSGGAVRFAHTGYASFAASLPADTEVLVGSQPSTGWELVLDGSTVPSRHAFGWATAFDADVEGRGTVRWSTPLTHQLVLAGQLTLVALVAMVMFHTRVERRLARRRVTA